MTETSETLRAQLLAGLSSVTLREFLDNNLAPENVLARIEGNAHADAMEKLEQERDEWHEEAAANARLEGCGIGDHLWVLGYETTGGRTDTCYKCGEMRQILPRS